MSLTPSIKRILTASITPAFRDQGITTDKLVAAYDTKLRESREGSYHFRWGTNLFWDMSWWFGTSDRDVRSPMARMNPSLREVVDFYYHPRITTLGARPFETLFLKSVYSGYGLDERSVRSVEGDIKENVGPIGYAMLLDTMNFIMTGKRDIPISMMVSYMDSGIDASGIVVTERFCRKELGALSPQEFLSRWISTEKGMSDCIEMHRLVYQIEF